MQSKVTSNLLMLCLVLGSTFQSSPIAAAELASAPAAVVTDFHETLLITMKTGSYEARILLLSKAIADHFQLETIARISLGRNWQTLTEEEKTQYQNLLSELITTTYAARFSQYDGQRFAIGSSEDIGRNRSRVRSTLTAASDIVSLDYQLQESEGLWRIYDVIANGVSDLSLKRSNYASLFNSGGLPAVEADIRSNIARNNAHDSATQKDE